MMKTILAALAIAALSLNGIAAQDCPPGMVYIEGGTFLMGKEKGFDNGPVHPVTVSGFYMDIHEVTNAEYLAFCEATGHKLPEFWGVDLYKSGAGYPDYPVVGVTSEDAARYAMWAGKRLPTEAEWEYAARGGLEGMPFPNGNHMDTTCANINNPISEKGPVPVMSYQPNGYGLYDMAGNVWEWVSDWYEESYYQNSPEENPEGPRRGRFRVIRGGGWHSGASCNRVDYRNALPQHWVDFAGGFRCVK